jgi:uncharacterized protein
MQGVKFKNRTIDMAGNLYLPRSFNDNEKYPAIVVVHPGGGVKEQVAGLYADMLAKEGFVTLAFDSSYQGESGGKPHFLDMPMNRVDDVYSAVDYMTTLPCVDSEGIGVAGICAGGGYAAKASAIDWRVKAVATASAVNTGAPARKGWDGKGSTAELMATLDAIAKQRTAEAAGAEVAYAPYVPELGDKSAPRDLREAADYYLTPRAQHPNAQNKMLFNAFGAWVGFDAFDVVDTLLTQPLLVIAGDEAGSLWHSQELYAKAPGPKELFLIKGAAHMDLYDGNGAVAAVNKMAPFFKSNLAPAARDAQAVAAE